MAANFYLIPGTVALLGWALLGERLTPLAMLGFAIASVGVFLVARHQPGDRSGPRRRRGDARCDLVGASDGKHPMDVSCLQAGDIHQVLVSL